ncbi:MAG TPA: outer membrane beta-barrel protein [Gemmatimonadales bacterium]|nr:outer membrane beta-barrel protein [Gemmatimonadales bacterium]
MRHSGQVAVAALLLSTPAGARAQAPATTLGLELGYSQAGFVGGTGALDESRQGTLFGAFVDRRIAGPLAAEVALFFSKKGGGISGAVEGVPVRISAQLVYLEVPLLARIAVPVGRFPLRPVVFGGGSLNFNIGCEFQAEVPGQVAQIPCRDSTGTGVEPHTVDFGAVVGGGFEYAWATSAIRLEFREHFGLRRVVPDDPLKNRAWAILFGVTI